MSAYIASLRKQSAASRAESRAPKSLRDRFVAWHAALPAVSRDRRFAMSEMEAALGTQGKYLGPVLLGLGWRRKRLWTAPDAPFARYWEPPGFGQNASKAVRTR